MTNRQVRVEDGAIIEGLSILRVGRQFPCRKGDVRAPLVVRTDKGCSFTGRF